MNANNLMLFSASFIASCIGNLHLPTRKKRKKKNLVYAKFHITFCVMLVCLQDFSKDANRFAPLRWQQILSKKKKKLSSKKPLHVVFVSSASPFSPNFILFFYFFNSSIITLCLDEH